MSFAAVYNVTRGIRMLLHSQIAKISSSAVVTLLPPGDALPAVSGVNLYLYRVAESPFTKNQPWRGDRITPPSNEPALGLTLSYLLTPLGTKPDDASFALGDDAHTMLGAAMLTLQENPVLNDVHLPEFDADTVLPDFLLNSFEQIKITLMPTNVEELSKIWAAINQPYRLSVAYEVSLVELTPTPPPPVNGGIVTTIGLNVFTLDAPRLASLIPPGGSVARISGGNLLPETLTITGSGFSFLSQLPTVRFGGNLVPILPGSPGPTDTAITVTLPTELDAGPQEDVRVTLNKRTSAPLNFTISPWLASVSPVRTALDIPGAALTLAGIGFTASPQSVRFENPALTTEVTVFNSATDTQASVTLPATLVNGIYNIRMVLNDANSSASNSRTLQVIPRVDPPIGVAVVVVAGNQVHRLTLNGARLDGADVRLVLDGVFHSAGKNTNATRIVFDLGRLLSAGAHTVAVMVDGQTSHTVDFGV
jgi:hypothetical protein